MVKQKVAVIFGGCSSEHEVSRVSARNVINNLTRKNMRFSRRNNKGRAMVFIQRRHKKA